MLELGVFRLEIEECPALTFFTNFQLISWEDAVPPPAGSSEKDAKEFPEVLRSLAAQAQTQVGRDFVFLKAFNGVLFFVRRSPNLYVSIMYFDWFRFIRRFFWFQC
jgi:hypothetical protein